MGNNHIKLPKNNKDLNEIFQKSTVPGISEFNGQYYVDMLTGLPSLRKLPHRKVFCTENGQVLGYNLLFSNIKWGCFFLQEGASGGLGASEAMIINYNRAENTFITNKMRDYIKCIQKGHLYIGKLNYLFRDKIYFLGYFSLEKIKTQAR